jgi:hypothetical protein
VYLKYSPSLRLYKIGKANNAKKRGAGISLLLPEDLVAKHEIKTDCPFILEKYWENRFREKRKQGDRRLLQFIPSLLSSAFLKSIAVLQEVFSD